MSHKSSLVQLQDLASRQQEQIEANHRLMVSKEHRLGYLLNGAAGNLIDQQSNGIARQMSSSNANSSSAPTSASMDNLEANLSAAKERLALQEAKIRQLQLLRAQIGKQRGANANICSEVETIKILYREKERELSAAMGKIDALTRQLEELKRGNVRNSYSLLGGGKQVQQTNSVELEKLRQELLHKNKLAKAQDEELLFKRQALYRRQADMLAIEQRVTELRSRLARKRQLNAQQISASSSATQAKTYSVDSCSGGKPLNTKGEVPTSSASSAATALFNGRTGVLRSSMGASVAVSSASANGSIATTTTTYKVPSSFVSSSKSAVSTSSQLSPNIATVEPFQRIKQGSGMKQYDFVPPSLDYQQHQQANLSNGSKYQTLPYGAKLPGHQSQLVPQQSNSSSISTLSSFTNPNHTHHTYHPSNQHDISLIISPNHHSHQRQKSLDSLGKNEEDQQRPSLEERPSPSGSSGSDDRISSSMASTSSAFDHHVYGGESGGKSHSFYSSSFVPNTLTDGKTGNAGSASKPSAPVKPTSVLISGNAEPTDCVDNMTISFSSGRSSNRYDHQLYGQKSQRSSADNLSSSQLSTPTSGVYSSSELFNSSEKCDRHSALLLGSVESDQDQASSTNADDLVTLEFEDDSQQEEHQQEFEDAANRRNEALEENNNNEGGSSARSTSVSEIVNRINQWSVSTSGNPNSSDNLDWEKTKRRPVVLPTGSATDSDSTLPLEMTEKLMESPEMTNKSSGKQEALNCSSAKQDLVNNNNNNNSSSKSASSEAVITTSTTADDVDDNGNTARVESSSSKPKRIKGSLKKLTSKENGSCGKQKGKAPLARRVSFDPLALLLDAALEGELELVKKTSREVPNPSASNDECITALHNATCAGHYDIVQYLVEIGCDVNAQDNDGWTPLHCAASCNNLPMIRYLVGAGACPFAATFSDRETAAEKCEEDEDGFDGCSQYLFGIQEQMGAVNGGLVYAQYDYEAVNEDELSFRRGDRVQVLRKVDEVEKGWWWARKVIATNGARDPEQQNTASEQGEEEGFIPRNLFSLYPRIEPSYRHHHQQYHQPF